MPSHRLPSPTCQPEEKEIFRLTGILEWIEILQISPVGAFLTRESRVSTRQSKKIEQPPVYEVVLPSSMLDWRVPSRWPSIGADNFPLDFLGELDKLPLCLRGKTLELLGT